MASPLLRIRAGIEAGNVSEVQAAVADAERTGVVLAPSVQQMLTQWLSVNAAPPPQVAPAPAAAVDVDAAPSASASGNDAEVKAGAGTAGWSAADDDRSGGPGKALPLSPELLRRALQKFLKKVPKDSDAAKGLGIIESSEGSTYVPLPVLGKAVLLKGADFEIAHMIWNIVKDNVWFALSEDARGVGLPDWAGWEEFSTNLASVASGTRDPAFEPRSIQGSVAKAARGAVRAGPNRQADVLKAMQESLNPQDMPEDAAPALRSAISRRTRLALACLVDAIASQGLGPQAGPDAMGLVGQMPRTLFPLIFDKMDDRDRGACAFLGEMLQSWDKRRCFSKRWLQESASKFSMPRGANPERDEGRGWYALTAENIHKKPSEGGAPEPDGGAPAPPKEKAAGKTASAAAEAAKEEEEEAAAQEESAKAQKGKKRGIAAQEEEDDEAVAKKLEESRKRRAALQAKYQS